MKIINGVKFYTSGEVAYFVGRIRETVQEWDKKSEMLEDLGQERLIPKPVRINTWRYWREEQLSEIIKFSKADKRAIK